MSDQKPRTQPNHNDTSELARNVPDNPNATICCVNNISLQFVARSDADFTVTDTTAELDLPEAKPASLNSDNTFEFERKFAEGGFGEVWQGAQNSLGRTIAIKRLRDEIYKDTQHDPTVQRYYEESFLREAIVTARLEHPNIVPIYDFGLDSTGKPLIAMKLVKGRPWGEMIKANRKLGVDDFMMIHLPILISVCQAVAFAHSKGILHRDLKPSQVMVGEFNEVLLMDWGLALVFDHSITPLETCKGAKAVKLTTRETSGNPAGTISFMAPEQTLEHGDGLGTWTDIYLLGGILYYLLTGFPPHHSPESSAAFLHAKMGYVEPPLELVKGKPIPLDLAEIAMKAMAPEKEDRLKTVHEFIVALERFLVSADHRKQSRDLVEQAEEKFEEAGSSYARIGQSMALVERAIGLWPANPSGAQLKQSIYKRFTELALKNNDLIMAKTQVEQMEESPEKTLLTAKVASTLRRSKIQSIALRTFMVFTIAALLGVSILSASLNESQARAYAAQEESDKKATETAQARQKAEDLVYFLVEDLSRELAGLYRLDLLDKIATEAMSYYDQSKTQNVELTKDDLRNRAELYKIIGDIRSLQGRLDPAKAAYISAQETYKTLLESQKNDFDLIRSSAEVEFKLAQTLILGQEIQKGQEVITTAKGFLLSLQKNPEWAKKKTSETADRVAELEASILQLEGMLFLSKGQSAVAVERQQKAETELLDLLSTSQNGVQLKKSLVKLYTRQSLFLRENGRYSAAEQSLKKGWDQLDQLLGSIQRDPSLTHLEAELNLEKATIDFNFGRLASAQSSLERALMMTQALLKQDDLNFNWKETHSRVLMLLATVAQLRGNGPLALNSAKEGLEIMQYMIEKEPKDIRRTTDLANMQSVYGLILAKTGQPTEAFKYAEDSRTLFQSLLSSEESLTIWGIMSAENSLREVRLRIEAKDYSGAAQLLAEVEKTFPLISTSDFYSAKLTQAETTYLGALLRARQSNAAFSRPALEQALQQLPSGFSLVTAPSHLLKVQAEILDGLDRKPEAAKIREELNARLSK